MDTEELPEPPPEPLDERKLIEKRARRLASVLKNSSEVTDAMIERESILLEDELNNANTRSSAHDKLIQQLRGDDLDQALDFMKSNQYQEGV